LTQTVELSRRFNFDSTNSGPSVPIDLSGYTSPLQKSSRLLRGHANYSTVGRLGRSSSSSSSTLFAKYKQIHNRYIQN